MCLSALSAMIAITHVARGLLDMSLKEPELLVDTARNLSQQVRSTCVTSLVSVIDVLAHGIRINGIAIDESRKMISDPVGI